MARVAPEHRREQERSADGYLPIEHHGIIGDLHTVALVGNEGTIDWFCPGRFDAPSLFGAILDAEIGGSFSLAPTGEKFTTKQLYLPGTAVLVTRFFTESGVGEVVDFMPLGGATCSIVRRVEVVRGSLRFRLRCAPAFDYARSPHRLSIEDGLATFTAADKMCELRSPTIELEADEDAAVAEFTLSRGERASFVLSGHTPGPRLGCRRGRALLPGDGRVLARVDRPEPLPRPLARDGRPLRHHAQAAHLPADRRGGGGADDEPARAHRRAAQLGLSLLLAA